MIIPVSTTTRTDAPCCARHYCDHTGVKHPNDIWFDIQRLQRQQKYHRVPEILQHQHQAIRWHRNTTLCNSIAMVHHVQGLMELSLVLIGYCPGMCREVMHEEGPDGLPVVTGLRMTKAGKEEIVTADAYVAALDVPGAKKLIPQVRYDHHHPLVCPLWHLVLPGSYFSPCTCSRSVMRYVPSA